MTRQLKNRLKKLEKQDEPFNPYHPYKGVRMVTYKRSEGVPEDWVDDPEYRNIHIIALDDWKERGV